MRKALVVIAALLVLGAINHAIYRNEMLLRDGQMVLLELAPVDPRSLMQGDYMALRFRLAADAFRSPAAGHPMDGRVVIALDERNVGSFRRFDDGTPLLPGEALLRYRIRKGEPRFATNAYFFQEGHGEVYGQARFGEFRVAKNGDCLLTALRDAELRRLGTAGS